MSKHFHSCRLPMSHLVPVTNVAEVITGSCSKVPTSTGGERVCQVEDRIANRSDSILSIPSMPYILTSRQEQPHFSDPVQLWQLDRRALVDPTGISWCIGNW